MSDKPSIESLTAMFGAIMMEVRYRLHNPKLDAYETPLRAALAELESLRAENEALKAERDALLMAVESWKKEEADWKPREEALYARAETANTEVEQLSELCDQYIAQIGEARLRAEALEARVEVLKQVAAEMLYQFSEPTHPGEECRRSGHVRLSTLNAWRGFFNSTPAADLEAHDAKVREPLEEKIGRLECAILDWHREDRDSEDQHRASQRLYEVAEAIIRLDEFPPGDYDAESLTKWGQERTAAHDARVRREALEEAWARLRAEPAMGIVLLAHTDKLQSIFKGEKP